MTFGVDEILVWRNVWLRFATVAVLEEVWEIFGLCSLAEGLMLLR